MGVDTYAILPGNCRVNNVAKVMGKLYGLRSQMRDIGHGCIVAEVEGVEIKMDERSPMATLQFVRHHRCECCQHRVFEAVGSAYYHFESDRESDRDGTRRSVSLGRSRSKNIAVGIGLVNFFGGRLVYSDHSRGEFYEVADKTLDENGPEDSQGWHDLQRRIHELPALTKEQIADCVKYAAYEE